MHRYILYILYFISLGFRNNVSLLTYLISLPTLIRLNTIHSFMYALVDTSSKQRCNNDLSLPLIINYDHNDYWYNGMVIEPWSFNCVWIFKYVCLHFSQFLVCLSLNIPYRCSGCHLFFENLFLLIFHSNMGSKTQTEK